jgi:hypothetical protein
MPYTTFTGRGSCLGPHVRTLLIHTECFILFVRDRFRSIDEDTPEPIDSLFTVSHLCTTPEVNRVRREGIVCACAGRRIAWDGLICERYDRNECFWVRRNSRRERASEAAPSFAFFMVVSGGRGVSGRCAPLSALTEQTSRMTPKTDGSTGGTTLLWLKLYDDFGSEWKRNYRQFKVIRSLAFHVNQGFIDGQDRTASSESFVTSNF